MVKIGWRGFAARDGSREPLQRSLGERGFALAPRRFVQRGAREMCDAVGGFTLRFLKRGELGPGRPSARIRDLDGYEVEFWV